MLYQYITSQQRVVTSSSAYISPASIKPTQRNDLNETQPAPGSGTPSDRPSPRLPYRSMGQLQVGIRFTGIMAPKLKACIESHSHVVPYLMAPARLS